MTMYFGSTLFLLAIGVCPLIWAWFLGREHLRLLSLDGQAAVQVFPITGWALLVRHLRKSWPRWTVLVGWPLLLTSVFASIFFRIRNPVGDDWNSLILLQPLVALNLFYPVTASICLALGAQFQSPSRLWATLTIGGILLTSIFSIALFYVVGFKMGRIAYVYPASLVLSAAIMLASFVFARRRSDQLFNLDANWRER